LGLVGRYCVHATKRVRSEERCQDIHLNLKEREVKKKKKHGRLAQLEGVDFWGNEGGQERWWKPNLKGKTKKSSVNDRERPLVSKSMQSMVASLMS